MEREERACIELFDGPDAPAALAPSPSAGGSEPARPSHRLCCPRCPSRCRSPRSRRIRGRTATTSTRSSRGSPTSSPRAGTACSSWRRRRRARSCATRARRVRSGALDAGAAARRGSSPSARRCRRCRAARRAALPIDVARTIADLFERAALDLCHVHEPFAPSVASAALRHSRALNVGTFHAPTERIVATQVARKVVQLVFGRLDARTAELRGDGRRCCERFFPGDYAIVAPGADAAPRAPARRRRAACASRSSSRRSAAALRLFLRALRRLDPALPWERGRALRARAVVLDAAARRPARARALRRPGRRATALARRRRARRGLRRRRARARAARRARQAAGAVPRRLAPGRSTRRSLGDGEAGLLFEPDDVDDARRPARAPGRRRRRCASACAPAARAAAVERGGRRARGALRARSRRAATTAAATPDAARAAAGAGASSTSTCTCTPTTATTARRRSRCCWPPRATRASARSPSPTTTRSPGALEAAAQGGRLRRQGHRRRGGQDRQPGRGHRPVPAGEDPARPDAGRRRSPRSSARAASSTCPHPFDRMHAVPDYEHLLDDRRRRRRDRGLQPARGDRLVQRGGGALRGQVPDPGRRRLGRPRRPGPRLGARAHARLRRPGGVPRVAARRPRSSPSRRACSTCRR